jgi:transaldolase
MATLDRYAEHGQSIWLDFIARSFIASGRLDRWIEDGLRGLTSNPTIFERAIAEDPAYVSSLGRARELSEDPEAAYEIVVLEDIRRAADALRPVYERAEGRDGFVSLEVRPALAHDTAGTVAEAIRLAEAVSRPNLMIKVPATAAGVGAIRELTARGIRVNATLIFSAAQYADVSEAYLSGLEERLAVGRSLGPMASVASFFVSRVDSAVDPILADAGASDLLGRVAIANARVAYLRFLELRRSARWQRLHDAGAGIQRPLWASTSTKNEAYPDTLYVDALVGDDTVNTVPLSTLEALVDHGRADTTLDDDIGEAQRILDRLSAFGIDWDALTESLQAVGIQRFAASYDDAVAAMRCTLQGAETS